MPYVFYTYQISFISACLFVSQNKIFAKLPVSWKPKTQKWTRNVLEVYWKLVRNGPELDLKWTGSRPEVYRKWTRSEVDWEGTQHLIALCEVFSSDF